MARITLDPLLNLSELGDWLGTGERFARRLIAEKRIEYVKLGAGRNAPVRVRQSVAERFIATHTVEAFE